MAYTSASTSTCAYVSSLESSPSFCILSIPPDTQHSAITIWLPVLVAVWFLLQYIFEIAAFQKRRHGLANIAICLFVVNFLLLVLAVALIAVNYHSFMSYENLYGDDEIFRLVKKILVIALIHFVVLSALQIFINLPGSIKTRRLLKSRRSLEITSTEVRIECYQV